MGDRAAILCTVLALGAGGCDLTPLDTGDPPDDVASIAQPIIGGSTAPFDDAVVMLSIGCTGTLIRPNVVLTAAHCLPSGSVSFGPAIGQFVATRRVVDSFDSRRYGSGLFAGGDIALLRLETDAPADIAPLPFNAALALTEAEHTDAEVRTVGFGNTDGINNTGFGTRRQVTHNILGIESEFIVTGTESANTCQGDSGGPTFLKINGVEHVIAVTSFGEGGCLGPSRQTRTDVFVTEFLDEVLQAWSGPCAYDGTCTTECAGFPDPDCDVCGVDGICSAGCARKDLDCPLAGAIGDLCADREACESLTCVEALDDPRIHYCSQECDPSSTANDFGCPGPLGACEQADDQQYYCRYEGTTPSAQGAPCTGSEECRSGMCDTNDNICVEPCGDGQAACADGFECAGIGGGQSACLLPHDSGICAAGRAGTTGSGNAPVMLIIAAAGLLVVRRRRKRTA